jgi:hypothetical protein
MGMEGGPGGHGTGGIFQMTDGSIFSCPAATKNYICRSKVNHVLILTYA